MIFVTVLRAHEVSLCNKRRCVGGCGEETSVAAFCSVLQCVAVYCSDLQCIAVRCSALQSDAVWCRVVQCGAAWFSVAQCEAMYSGVATMISGIVWCGVGRWSIVAMHCGGIVGQCTVG